MHQCEEMVCEVWLCCASSGNGRY